MRVAVYELILELAPRRLRGERKGHTFQVTALANEIWKKLDERKMLDVLARGTTPATKALIGGMIRHFLIDYGRRRLARFRAEGHHQLDVADVDIELDLSAFAAGANCVAVTVFVDALDKLAELDPEASEVFNLRVFAGLKSQEIAEMLNRAVRTVQLAYKRAQVILAREIEGRIDP